MSNPSVSKEHTNDSEHYQLSIIEINFIYHTSVTLVCIVVSCCQIIKNTHKIIVPVHLNTDKAFSYTAFSQHAAVLLLASFADKQS